MIQDTSFSKEEGSEVVKAKKKDGIEDELDVMSVGGSLNSSAKAVRLTFTKNVLMLCCEVPSKIGNPFF